MITGKSASRCVRATPPAAFLCAAPPRGARPCPCCWPPWPLLQELHPPAQARSRHAPLLSPQFSLDDASATVSLGGTRALAAVAAALEAPFSSHSREGALRFHVELSPMADPAFESGRMGEGAVELARVVERAVKQSGAVDMEALCVLPGRKVRPACTRAERAGPCNRGACLACMRLHGCRRARSMRATPPCRALLVVRRRSSPAHGAPLPTLPPTSQVWSLRVDVRVLDNCGNLVDACCLAALAALVAYRKPQASVRARPHAPMRTAAWRRAMQSAHAPVHGWASPCVPSGARTCHLGRAARQV